MEKEIVIKVSRCLELSKKFQKSEHQIFELNKTNINQLIGVNYDFAIQSPNDGYIFATNNHTIFINDREIYIDDNGVLKAKDKQPITRAEKILAQAKLDAIFADEYDEYIKLQNDLTNYFLSLNKLIENK